MMRGATMRAGLKYFCAALFVALLLSARADACSCLGGGTPCSAYGKADAVFVGTVTGVREKKPAGRDDEDAWLPRVFKFSVQQSFLGAGGAEVEVATGQGGGDCGYAFRSGETYLVYAYGSKDGKRLATGICTRTRPVADASEDLEYLRGLAALPPGVSISVQVARHRQQVKTGDSKPAGPLADAQVVVEGEGERREAKTDAEGYARLSGLKPGAYRVRLVLPEELTTYKEVQEIKLADRGCGTVFYSVADNGRVEGRISDAAGQPAAGVLVTLFEADDKEPEKSYARYERTNAEGVYAFKGVPPGRYHIAVNLARYPEPGDATNAYPRTFYPGVARLPDAEAVTLGAGEAARGRDFALQPRRAESVVEGVVVWDDGSPVAGASISVRDLTYHDPGMDYGLPAADERGRFTLKGYQGQVLLIRAESRRPFVGDYGRDGPMERAEPVRVTLAAPTEPVRIRITKLR